MMDTDPFDPAEFLASEEARAEYVAAALETGDVAFVARSFAIVERARNLTAALAQAASAEEEAKVLREALAEARRPA